MASIINAARCGQGIGMACGPRGLVDAFDSPRESCSVLLLGSAVSLKA